VPTRFHLANHGAAPVSPAYDSGWEQTGQADRVLLLAKARSEVRDTLANSTTITVPITTTQDILCRQFVSEPLPAVRIALGTSGLNLVVRAFESATTANVTLAVVVKVVSNDGTVVRGTILSNFNNDTEFALSAAAATRRAGAGLATTAVSAQFGDRLVVEVGGHAAAPTAATSFNLRFGNSATSDFANSSGLTTDLNPWVELSQDIWGEPFNNFRSARAGDGISVAERPRPWGAVL
jgi:hypothetical protein